MMKPSSLDKLLHPLVNTWWSRFYAKFENYYFSCKTIDSGTCYKFCGLHFGLKKEQIRHLVHYWESCGLLEVKRNGWLILRTSQTEEDRMAGTIASSQPQ